MDGRRPQPAARPAVEALEGRALLNGAGYEPPAPPRVVEIARLGRGTQPTVLFVQFDQDLLQGSVRAGNFLLAQPNRNGSFRRGNPDVIPTRFAGFRPTGTVDGVVQYDFSTVVLVPGERLNLHRTYQLTINGNFTGVASQFGIVLDGDGDGQPGGMFTGILRGPGPWRPGPAAARR